MDKEQDATIIGAGDTPSYTAKWLTRLISIIAVGLSLFQLYAAAPFFAPFNLFFLRSVHLSFILVLVFLLFPAFGAKRRRGPLGWLIDGAFIAGAVYSGYYLSANLDAIISRAGFWEQSDITAGIITVVVLLEGSRRVIGLSMTLIAGAFIGYAFLGPYMPGILQHRGYDVNRIVAQLYLGQEGIYGVPLGVAATFVFIFILFGAFLEVTGGGKFFIDLAYSAAGRQRGGPAKASVIASAMMGSISGSAIANVVTTGAFTIPLMKRLGYKPHEAGGIEAAASTGGQIMPPIMGAGAFLIAEFTGSSYLEIVKLSILPAIMYFATVYLFVDILAAKRGMTGMARSELPKIGQVMKEGWHFLLPIGILVFFLIINVSPSLVGFIAIVSIVAVAVLKALTLLAVPGLRNQSDESESLADASVRGAKKLWEALETGAKNALMVSTACAVAGIIVGVVGLTGLGLKFSAMVLSFSFGNILLALLLVILASLVLGMGLPVTASYIVLIVLAGPALTNEFGIPLIIAHLLVFWYSQDSNVTPPVALAAFAGAGIAGSDPMRTGVAAWKFAKGLYLIPLFMVFNPEFITGGPILIVIWTVVTAFAALGAFAAALEGYMFTHMYLASRLAVTLGMVGIFWPNHWAEVAGFVLILVVLGVNWNKAQREKREAQAGVGLEPSESSA